MKEFGNVEYSMPKAQADFLLKIRKGDEKKVPIQQYLCDYVNTRYGVRGKVVRVIIE